MRTSQILHRIRRPWSSLPWTCALLLLIVGASWLAHDQRGELERSIANQVGHAPKHMMAGEILRVLTSIPFTQDRNHLAAALIMTTLCVGSCELALAPPQRVRTF